MIVAQYKCGCSLHQNNTPNCLQCCSASRALQQQTFSANCWRDKFPKQLRKRSDGYNSIGGNECCPSVQIYEEEEPERKIESEIEARGKPYKELEAIINENRILLRMQIEPPPIVYDPPCDCLEDEENAQENPSKLCPSAAKDDNSDVRTFVVYTDPKAPAEVDPRKHKHEPRRDSVKPTAPVVHDYEENPNIFLLRIRKQDGNIERKNNFDLEFKTPRPWSQKMKAEAEMEARSIKARAKEMRAIIRADKKKKKKKKKK